MALTKDKHGVRECTEHGEEEATDETRAENLQQELAPIGEESGGQEHQVPINKDEEDVAQRVGGAGQEAISRLAATCGGRGGPPAEADDARGKDTGIDTAEK